MDKRPIGNMLVEAGFITKEQVKLALKEQKESGQRIGDIIVSKGWIKQEDLMKVLELQHKVEFIDLSASEIDTSLIAILPVDTARRQLCAPVRIDGKTLIVAVEDPRDFRVLDEIRRVTRMSVKPAIASSDSIKVYLDRLYGNVSAQRALSEFSKDTKYEDIEEINFDTVANAPIVKLMDALIAQAVGLGASDIHIEPMPDLVRVRMRVDGILTSVLDSPLSTLSAMIARIKILAGLNIAERRVPQDGRFHININNRDIDLRVSTMPVVFGEKAVMRLLDRTTFLIPKEKLGFTKTNLMKFNRLLSTPHGIILITGPTGSGKTTTLYTMLAEINSVRDNIVTVEDPVEYMMRGINQTQVNPKAGIDFANGLRAILRQDPDIIMVGEIRDSETVDMAIRASVTGHLVLSTLHTNDCISSIFRLIDMGVPSYMVASSLVAVIAQRLVRLICKNCKVTYEPIDEEIQSAGLSLGEAKNITFLKGMGCPDCNHTGYKGRMAVHEFLMFDAQFRELVHRNVTIDELRRYAVDKQGMVLLRSVALGVLKEGNTTLEEVIALAGDDMVNLGD